MKTVELSRDHQKTQNLLGGTFQTTTCRHGRGVIGLFMEHGLGYFIQMPGHLSLLLTGDTILTRELETTVASLRLDVVVAPAGGVRFDIGSEITMNAQDMVALARLTPGKIIANHIADPSDASR